MSEPQAIVEILSEGMTEVVEVIHEQGPKGDPPSDEDIQALVDAAIAARNPGTMDFTILDSAALATAIGAL